MNEETNEEAEQRYGSCEPFCPKGHCAHRCDCDTPSEPAWIKEFNDLSQREECYGYPWAIEFIQKLLQTERERLIKDQLRWLKEIQKEATITHTLWVYDEVTRVIEAVEQTS